MMRISDDKPGPTRRIHRRHKAGPECSDLFRPFPIDLKMALPNREIDGPDQISFSEVGCLTMRLSFPLVRLGPNSDHCAALEMVVFGS